MTNGRNGADEGTHPLRALPSVERVLADGRVMPLTARHGHEAVVTLVRTVLDELRAELLEGRTPTGLDAAGVVVQRASSLERSLRPVINATGVVIHTNLGRAPLSDAALEAMREIGADYSNLEFDLDEGGRGSRFAHLGPLLSRLTGAEAAIAVNNNASALLLALSALAKDREVIISRGQLVEIGGGFRIPDVMRQSGAHLVEVGTTNRTRLRDYAEAISENTGALLRVHASNFRVVGFTEDTALADLASLARERGLLLIDDVGSGALIDPRRYGLEAEPLVRDSVAAGADVVLFSGDKLLGGPQAGIAVGRREAIEAMQRHPLARAVRMDKASIAALAATLEHYARGEADEAVPVWRMISMDAAVVRRRAQRLARSAKAAGARAEVVESRSMVGGGSLPEESLPSYACAVGLDVPDGGGADALAAALRQGDPAVVGRIEAGRVLLDPRTVDPRQDRRLEAALASAIATATASLAGADAPR
ncbi:MAG: L-seryl-tRNA(Sec) selenium transferase [Dehalococcoidia bacterium]